MFHCSLWKGGKSFLPADRKLVCSRKLGQIISPVILVYFTGKKEGIPNIAKWNFPTAALKYCAAGKGLSHDSGDKVTPIQPKIGIF